MRQLRLDRINGKLSKGETKFEINCQIGTYTGEIINKNVANGDGTFTNKFGTYIGTFARDMANGYCCLQIKNGGDVQVGEMKDNRFDGKSTIYHKASNEIFNVASENGELKDLEPVSAEEAWFSLPNRLKQ